MDGYDPRLLCQQPCECDLCWRRAFAFCDGLNQIDENHIGLPRLARETWHHVAKIGRIEFGVFVDLTS